MEKLRKLFLLLSFIFIGLCFGASVWLYVVLRDNWSLTLMVILFLAAIWYGYNARNVLFGDD